MRGGGKEEEEISSEIERRTQKNQKEREDSGTLKRRENKNQKNISLRVTSDNARFITRMFLGI